MISFFSRTLLIIAGSVAGGTVGAAVGGPALGAVAAVGGRRSAVGGWRFGGFGRFGCQETVGKSEIRDEAEMAAIWTKRDAEGHEMLNAGRFNLAQWAP